MTLQKSVGTNIELSTHLWAMQLIKNLQINQDNVLDTENLYIFVPMRTIDFSTCPEIKLLGGV